MRSPSVSRRHADTFGIATPNRSATNCNCEVWSKVSEHTQPPALNGETTYMGTRTPMPTGPAMPPAVEGNGRAVMYSP